MKIRAIRLADLRRFTAPVTVEDIGDGLNVLSEPNEQGKSTLFDAIQALFFLAHGSRGKEVKALQPHAGGAPEVTIEVETEAGRFAVSKRWLSKPQARVHQDGRLIAQADAAEAWIGDLLGGGGGPAGLVWVRQGMTGLESGSRNDQAAALEARRDLLSSVTGEVEAMTGGRRMDDALARCRAELGVYATAATGRPLKSGPWRAAEDRVREAEGERDALAETSRALSEALSERSRIRRDLSELEDPAAVAERRERLTAAIDAHRLAERHAEKVAQDARKIDAAQAVLNSAIERRDGIAAAMEESAAADREATDAAMLREGARRGHAETRQALLSADRDLTAAVAARDASDTVRRQAARRQAARDGADRRRELAERIARADAARQAMETLAVAARMGPDPAVLREIESLAAELSAARALRDAAAVQITMHFETGRENTVTRAGTPLPGDEAIPVPHGADLLIQGVGTLSIRPGAAGPDDDGVARAEAALARALDAAGASDPEDARQAADARAEAERGLGAARATWQSLAPDGIDALRDAHARIPAPEGEGGDGDLPDLPAAEKTMAEADLALATARSHKEAAAARDAEARNALAGAEATAEAAADRKRRADRAVERFGTIDPEAVDRAVEQAAASLRSAEAVHAQGVRAAPDLPAAEAALSRARAVDDQSRQEIDHLSRRVAALDERIRAGAGDAVEERLAGAEDVLREAETELRRIENEVAVLRRLQRALETARSHARERYFAPVAAELRPLLSLLWPDADLNWGQDRLLPESLSRDGRDEPIEILSGGTQEQIALLVRLAFARMLARDGRHAPVILDDALVFTDDDRIERMFDALHRQAGDLQIIVLTCRQRAFRALGGKVLRLSPADQTA